MSDNTENNFKILKFKITSQVGTSLTSYELNSNKSQCDIDSMRLSISAKTFCT